jgi:PleD family two-component response regulator
MEDETRQLICVVDDERTNALMLSMMLEADFDVCVAHTGRDAITMIRERQPDLILLDIVLPDLNGYEVFAELKGDPATNDIPVIFVTGLEDSENEKIGLEVGAADYVSKPLNAPVVKARISRVLQINLYIEFLEQLVCLRDAKIDSLKGQAREVLDKQFVS